ncbi:hypothetical protein EX238_22910, partial [Providencia rettgeri]|nr:hypothetical protein [Providencia rettgeri]
QGLANYSDDAANVFQAVNSLVSDSFKGMEDALVQFATTGKASFSDLANSIIQDMIRIAIQQSITGPLAGALGGMFGSAPAPAGVTPGLNWSHSAGSFASGGYTGAGGKYEPKGIVHANEGVLNSDEIRAIGGEAGFNALRQSIRRGHATGGMAGYPALPSVSPAAAGGVVNVTVNVSGDGQGSQVDAPAGWEQFAEEIGAFVDSRIQKREVRGYQDGGIHWNARQGLLR